MIFPVYNSRKSPCKNFGKNLRSSAYNEHRIFLHLCIPYLFNLFHLLPNFYYYKCHCNA